MKKRYTWLSVKKSSAAADMFDTEQIEVPMALTSIRACGGLYKGAQGRPHLDFKMDFKSPATHRRRRTSNEMMIQSNLQSNVVCLATRINITSTYQTLLHPLVCKLNYCKSPTVNLYLVRLQRIPQRNLNLRTRIIHLFYEYICEATLQQISHYVGKWVMAHWG